MRLFKAAGYLGNGRLGADFVFIAARSAADTYRTYDLFTRFDNDPSRHQKDAGEML